MTSASAAATAAAVTQEGLREALGLGESDAKAYYGFVAGRAASDIKVSSVSSSSGSAASATTAAATSATTTASAATAAATNKSSIWKAAPAKGTKPKRAASRGKKAQSKPDAPEIPRSYLEGLDCRLDRMPGDAPPPPTLYFVGMTQTAVMAVATSPP